MKVAVLGCGPAGLFAAHAANQLGHDVTILSRKKQSVITGAQYLHSEVPDVTDGEPHGVLNYVRVGNAQGYAHKVYGTPDAPCSWHRFPSGEYAAWSLEAAYRNLMALYWDEVLDLEIDCSHIADICGDHEAVLCTVPARDLCYRHEHRFDGQEVVITKQQLVHVHNLIVYNGRMLPTDRWYRASNIFGHCSTEYSMASVRDAGLYVGWQGVKPVSTDCDCHEDHMNFHRLGRFGRWEKSVLVDDAYRAARDLLTPTVSRVVG